MHKSSPWIVPGKLGRLLLIFLVYKILISLFLYTSDLLIENSKWDRIENKGKEGLEVFITHLAFNWDGGMYEHIVNYGYKKTEPEFFRHFPLFPLSVWILKKMVGLKASLIIVPNIFFILGITFFLKTSWILVGEESASKALYLLLFYPAAFYYGSGYSESLFLFLWCASWYFGLKQKWVLSWTSASLLILTRVFGILNVPFLFLEQLRQVRTRGDFSGSRQKHGKLPLLLVFIPVITSVGLLYFFQIESGDPFIFIKSANLNRHVLTTPWNAFFQDKTIVPVMYRQIVLRNYPWLIMTFLILTAISFKSFRKFYPIILYSWCVFILHLCHWHESYVRMSLEIVPQFIFLGILLKGRNEWFVGILITFAIYFGLLGAMFINFLYAT